MTSEELLHGHQRNDTQGSLENEKKKNTKLTPPEKSPFDKFKISNTAPLWECRQRVPCPKCERPMKYFCYFCYTLCGFKREDIPLVNLPIKLDIIKHEQERDGKSTAVHAKIISPNDVEIYPHTAVPDYEGEDVVLLYPGPTAKRIDKLNFKKLVVIDGTWRQASSMARNIPALARLPQVTIAPHETTFWRYQNKDINHLATIEAIYYFMREYAELRNNAYNGEYDDLLFYYKFFYELIQQSYRTEKRIFNRRQRDGYIVYDD
ncbi:uncharacterized protein VTP21DRAFT_7288 [Calcarisporiella thermophila]|uniref:uncharacterized protein n=1 Tax=Calcarisporiella thermophila TaxID=911321 RepID=UPI003743C65F